MTRPVRADPPRAGDPYGTGIVGDVSRSGLAIVGLLIVAIFTVTLLNGQLPFGVGQTPSGNGGTGNDGPDRTPAPSNVVVVPDRPGRAAVRRGDHLRQGGQHLGPDPGRRRPS